MTCTYESDLVKRVGLHTAIMMSLLQQEQLETEVEGKLVDDKYFKLDQNWITEMTGFAKQEQDAILKALLKIKVLVKHKKDATLYFFDEEYDPESLKDLKVMDKQLKAEMERNSKIKFLRTKIETQNTELLQAYFDWIDAVYDKQGWLPVKAVEVAQRDLDLFTNRDLDVALDVLEIAAVNGYRDVNWAINSYVDKKKNSNSVKTTVYNNSTVPNVTLTDEAF